MYWETPNNWFSSLPCAGERALAWHVSSASSKTHWDPFSCESEQRKASGEPSVLQPATQLVPHTTAGKSWFLSRIKSDSLGEPECLAWAQGTSHGKGQTLPGCCQAGGLPGMFWLCFLWVRVLINRYMCISWFPPPPWANFNVF